MSRAQGRRTPWSARRCHYPFEDIGTAIADSPAGTAVKQVLTFGPVR
ncbi:MAG TPA: hypothetical protein VG142_01645 [Trebonia sp.]|nr:hypothetical protein [Trebonia sp.]